MGKEEVAPLLKEISIIQRQGEELSVKRLIITISAVVEALGLKQIITQVACIVIKLKQLIKSNTTFKINEGEILRKIKMRNWIYFLKLLRRKRW